jgi:hypothetical protein
MHLRRFCLCGRQTAYLLFRDNLLPPAVLVNLYCPDCQDQAQWDAETMMRDNGWIMEFDIPVALKVMSRQGLEGPVTPEWIFDEGYVSWQGLSPLDHEESEAMHRRLAPLIHEDLALYLKTLKSQWSEHVAALKAAGWRKAQST